MEAAPPKEISENGIPPQEKEVIKTTTVDEVQQLIKQKKPRTEAQIKQLELANQKRHENFLARQRAKLAAAQQTQTSVPAESKPVEDVQEEDTDSDIEEFQNFQRFKRMIAKERTKKAPPRRKKHIAYEEESEEDEEPLPPKRVRMRVPMREEVEEEFVPQTHSYPPPLPAPLYSFAASHHHRKPW